MRDRIAHIFFDLDRTLWDFDTNSKEAILEIFESFRLTEHTAATPADFLGVYAPINEHYWERYRNQEVTQADLRRGRFLDALRHFGCDNIELADALGAAYVDISPRKTALVDGAMELLHHLHGRYALHIITNGFEEVQHIKLKSSGLIGFFGEVITSERAGVKKPDAGIFRFAEQLTSARPHSSLMIGDHFEADVQGALQAGWRSIHFDPAGPVAGGQHHVSSLREVMGLL